MWAWGINACARSAYTHIHIYQNFLVFHFSVISSSLKFHNYLIFCCGDICKKKFFGHESPWPFKSIQVFTRAYRTAYACLRAHKITQWYTELSVCESLSHWDKFTYIELLTKRKKFENLIYSEFDFPWVPGIHVALTKGAASIPTATVILRVDRIAVF